MELAMIEDRIVPMAELDPVYMDRGTYFGDGVYEVVRSYDGGIFALDEHLERFGRSLAAIEIGGVAIENIRGRVERAYENANISDAKIYFHITRGSEPRDHAGGEETRPNFFLTITEIGDLSEEKEHGISVSTFPDWRWKRCDIKSLNLLANVLARRDAEKRGCKEAIMLNDKAEITEGAGSAFFMVLGQSKQLITRPLGPEILPSITRNIILQLADKAGLTIIEKAITPFQANWADELFIAVTTKDIVPVVEFDGQRVGDGLVGEYTKILMNEFQKFVKEQIR